MEPTRSASCPSGRQAIVFLAWDGMRGGPAEREGFFSYQIKTLSFFFYQILQGLSRYGMLGGGVGPVFSYLSGLFFYRSGMLVRYALCSLASDLTYSVRACDGPHI